MKPNQSILILLSIFLISNCGEKVREEISERYDDGKKKTIMKFVGEGSEEVMVEKIGYSQSGDTLIWENYDSKGERDGKWTSDYENGQIKEELGRMVNRLERPNGTNLTVFELGVITRG